MVNWANIVACLFLLFSMSEQADEGYLRVKCDANEGPEAVNQGRPGKVGPAGLPGQKGEQGLRGPPGEGVGVLLEEMRSLKERVTLLQSLMSIADKVEHCSVGMKAGGSVENNQITASSVWSSAFAAYQGRVNNNNGQGGVWVPHQSRRRAGEWLQVDLRNPMRVTGVVTQGRTNLDEWTTGYIIQYGNSTSRLQTIQDDSANDLVFPGNTDRNSYVDNNFPRPIVARHFRLVVRSFHRALSLRMDYFTC